MIKLLMPDIWVSSVYSLSVDLLKELNIRGLIFDIDNTLVAYDAPKPDAEIKNLLEIFKAEGFKICFASNNSKKRVGLFNRELLFDAFPMAMKPLPFSIKKALKIFGLKPKETAIIGDQIFTDVLAGRLAGVKTIFVDYISAKESFFFKFKRMLERPVLAFYLKKKDKHPDIIKEKE